MAIRLIKAKKPRRGTTVKVRPSRARDEALANQMASGFSASFRAGVRAMQAHLDPDALARAYMAADYSGLMRQIPVDKMPEYLGAAVGRAGKAMVSGSKSALALGKAPHGLRFDLSNPRVANYMKERSGALIQNVTDQFQAYVGKLVERRFASSTATSGIADALLTPTGRGKTVGFVLKYGLGLDERSAAALASRTASGNYTKEQLREYETQLHVARADRIARTEVAYAMNNGRQQVWDAQQEQGLIPDHSMKVWTVDGDPCKLCIQLDGVAVDLGDNFIAPDGTEIARPPLHPHCMCILQLDTGADDEDIPNRDASEDEDV